ncbi:hypothetical protein [Pseudonocardia cypriaca]|uniref:Uncharacterized protein n=1 Tax=Pseudonocardia cypriaca TaxID=882449 RepID=A0A543GFP7_9PSEU|nr:hypothetical protein [Pseudonocardia cypriaca]TQM44912.1 hypothetical protein FB388_2300 [Pseudonocardia cypriaca]
MRRWSRRSSSAAAGGFRISDGFISPLDLVAIGMVSAQEAAELHALETATVGAPRCSVGGRWEEV